MYEYIWTLRLVLIRSISLLLIKVKFLSYAATYSEFMEFDILHSPPNPAPSEITFNLNKKFENFVVRNDVWTGKRNAEERQTDFAFGEIFFILKIFILWIFFYYSIFSISVYLCRYFYQLYRTKKKKKLFFWNFLILAISLRFF